MSVTVSHACSLSVTAPTSIDAGSQFFLWRSLAPSFVEQPTVNSHQQSDKILEGHDHEISFIAVSLDDKTITPGSKDKTLRAWRLELEDGREMIE